MPTMCIKMSRHYGKQWITQVENLTSSDIHAIIFFFTNSYPFKFIVNFTPSSPNKKVLNSMDRQGKDSAGVSSDLVFSSHGSWLPARDAGIQAMQKQSGWRSAEVFNLGTWCMPIICHHQHCFCEFLPQWLSSSCARTAFPFSLSVQYSHPVIFSSAQITKQHSRKDGFT